MFKNYITIAFRNLVKSKVHSFINIAGLATGMAVAILIGLWIWNELSFNKQFGNHDRIARVMQNHTFDGEIRTWGSTPMQIGPELRNTYGQYFQHVVMAGWIAKHTLSYGEKSISNTGNYMEPGAPDMLTLDMLQGTRAGLSDMSSILLSHSVAKALFGDADPVDKLIRLDNKLDVKVTGVYKDLPANSDFSDLNFIAPWELMVKNDNLVEREIGWGNSWFQTFVQVADNAAMAEVSAKIKNAKLNKVNAEEAKAKPEVFLQPMNRWHLHSEFKNGREAGGPIRYLWMFGIIGIFVLLLACINFMNLSTARSAKRAREVGIRKAIGSLRGQLVSQFFSESLLVTALAFVVALLLAALALPWFNEVAGKKIVFPLTSPGFWIAGLTFSFFTGMVAGAYPALYLSSFQPVKVLKGTFKTGPLAAIPRKILVVLQFTVSVTLIICTVGGIPSNSIHPEPPGRV